MMKNWRRQSAETKVKLQETAALPQGKLRPKGKLTKQVLWEWLKEEKSLLEPEKTTVE